MQHRLPEDMVSTVRACRLLPQAGMVAWRLRLSGTEVGLPLLVASPLLRDGKNLQLHLCSWLQGKKMSRPPEILRTLVVSHQM